MDHFSRSNDVHASLDDAASLAAVVGQGQFTGLDNDNRIASRRSAAAPSQYAA